MDRRSTFLCIALTTGLHVGVRPGAAQEAAECAAGRVVDGIVLDRATRVPLVGAAVSARSPGRALSGYTDDRGRFRFCGFGEGASVEVAAEHAGVRSPLLTVDVARGGDPVSLVIDLGEPAPVSVAVADADSGDPIEGVTIRLEPSVIGGVSNEAGSAGLGQVPPGEYRLRADHLAFHPFEGAVFIGSGEPHRLTISMRGRPIALDTLNVFIAGGQCAGPGVTSVSGRVVDRKTRLPMSDAVVQASLYDAEAGFTGQRATADEEGGFVLCGMPLDARVRLQATAGARRSDARFLDVEPAGDAIILEIDNGEPGFVALLVSDGSSGAPVEGAVVRLRPLPLGGITNDRGRLSIREAPPGRYEVRVDHFAYASFEGSITIGDEAAEEWEIPLSPTAIGLAPLEVRVTGRDPYLLGLGFYDRMMDEKVEGRFYDYWDFESYATLGSFTIYKTFVRPDIVIPFVNGKPASRTGYRSLNEIPFGKIRGVEFIRCVDLPPELARWINDFEVHAARQNAGYWDCVAQLIWRGERRVRSEREPPTDRCARERRQEIICERARADSLASAVADTVPSLRR